MRCSKVFNIEDNMKIKGLRVLVTGGAGFIGSNLVDVLAKNNSVVVFDNFSSGTLENVSHHMGKGNVEVVRGDIRDKELLRKATKGIDVVYHLAVQCLRISINDPEINHEVNATGSLNVCMAAHEHRVKRLIYVSSSEIYGTAVHAPMFETHPCEPTTVYGGSKLAGEKYAMAFHRTYKLPAMVVRPFNTYGPRVHLKGNHGEVIPKFFIRAMNDQPPVIFGDGEQTRDFTHVADTVRGIIQASECEAMIGQAVNIARGEEVSINQIARKIYAILGKEDILPRYEKPRPGDVRRHFADVKKAQRMLGFRAKFNIDSGLEKYRKWFLAQDYDMGKLYSEDVIFNW